MGTFLTKLFVDVETLPHDGYGFVQLLFLGGVYAYVLMTCSGMISDGSELLLLVPALAGVVGSVVLPVLGAVPDGAIVLFSGLGPDAQQQLNVGIGALAGSTIMLLTVPWCLSIFGGRVNLDEEGNGNYTKPRGAGPEWRKLDPPNRFLGSGVNAGPAIKYTSKVMLVTLIPFFIIQIPSFVGKCGLKNDVDTECHSPRLAALIGGVFAVLLFAFYLWDQSRLANTDEVKEDKIDQLRAKAVQDGLLTLRGLFPTSVMDNQGVIAIDAKEKRFRDFLRPFFRKFDADGSGTIDANEFALLVASLGERPSKEELAALLAIVDTDKSGSVSFDEFAVAMAKVLNNELSLSGKSASGTFDAVVAGSASSREAGGAAGHSAGSRSSINKGAEEGEGEEGESDDDEEVEMPEDLASLSPQEQQKKLIKRSFLTMGVGVFVVLLFSDPAVDVLSELGNRMNIKPFYIAFILAPLASNASELIAAYNYSQKKSEKTITISFASLCGAACMNNTFCLSIFLFLVYAKNLKWEFAAETLAILIVELIMFVFAQMRVQRAWYALVVFALMPLSIVFVALVEQAGLD